MTKEVIKVKGDSDIEDDSDNWGKFKGSDLPPVSTDKAMAAPQASKAIPNAEPQASSMGIARAKALPKKQAMCKAHASAASIPKVISKALPAAKQLVSIKGSANMEKRPGQMVFGLPHLIQSGKGQRVYVWPTGIMNLQTVCPAFLAWSKDGHGDKFVPSLTDMLNDFRVILPADQRKLVEGCTMVIVDAQGPPAMELFDATLRDHCGTHPDILEQLLANAEFTNGIGRQLAAQWPKVPLAQDEAIGVLVFSKSGMHRSVAWSYLIWALMLGEGCSASVFKSVMSRAGEVHQHNCTLCSMGLTQSLLTKAIVNLSLVPLHI